MRKWIINGLIVVFAVIFLVCGFLLIRYFWESAQQQKVYDELASMMDSAMATAPTLAVQYDENGAPLPAEQSDLWIDVTDPLTGETVQLLPEFAQLYTMNNQIVGWLRIDGTKINYPVMQSVGSPDYYLKRDFNKDASSHGCLYAREDCDIFAPSDNITIYGHFMKDGSMLAGLDSYKKADYRKKHPTFSFSTLRERHTYEIFAVFLTTASIGKGFEYHMFVDAQTPAEFEEFVARCQRLSLYDTGITPVYGDKLITLSTCEYSQTNGRLVVVARRID